MFIEARSITGRESSIINVDYIDMIRTRDKGESEIFVGSKIFIGNDKIVRLIATLATKKVHFIRLHYNFDKTEFYVRKNKVKYISWDTSGDHALLILDGTRETISTLENYLEIKKLLEE